VSSLVSNSYLFFFFSAIKIRIFIIGGYIMQKTALTLNDLEADVVQMEVFVRNLARAKRVLRDIKNVLETVQTITGAVEIQTPETVSQN
jgi:hypothetical protein